MDQYTSPSYVPNISKMMIEVINKKITGIIHLADSTRISRYDFAVLISKKMNISQEFFEPIKIDQMNWKAQRPMDSSLDTSKANKMLKNKPQKLEKSIELLFN